MYTPLHGRARRLRPVLLITPPMVQFNTAYPAVPMLAAFLRRHGHPVAQEDLSLRLALRLFSFQGVKDVERALRRRLAGRRRPPSVRHFLARVREIESCRAGRGGVPAGMRAGPGGGAGSSRRPARRPALCVPARAFPRRRLSGAGHAIAAASFSTKSPTLFTTASMIASRWPAMPRL